MAGTEASRTSPAKLRLVHAMSQVAASGEATLCARGTPRGTTFDQLRLWVALKRFV